MLIHYQCIIWEFKNYDRWIARLRNTCYITGILQNHPWTPAIANEVKTQSAKKLVAQHKGAGLHLTLTEFRSNNNKRETQTPFFTVTERTMTMVVGKGSVIFPMKWSSSQCTKKTNKDREGRSHQHHLCSCDERGDRMGKRQKKQGRHISYNKVLVWKESWYRSSGCTRNKEHLCQAYKRKRTLFHINERGCFSGMIWGRGVKPSALVWPVPCILIHLGTGAHLGSAQPLQHMVPSQKPVSLLLDRRPQASEGT